MTGRLEVLDLRTLLSGMLPDGRHAVLIGGTAAPAWIETKGAPSGGGERAIACSTPGPISGEMGYVRTAANASNNSLYDRGNLA
jgi:hypothetical protein